jgi:hypothetical protein
LICSRLVPILYDISRKFRKIVKNKGRGNI